MLPDGRAVACSDALLPDPSAGSGRLVFWVRGGRDGAFQHWERVAAAAGAKHGLADGVRFVPVTVTPARQRLGPPVVRLLARLVRSTRDREVVLPDGRPVEWNGPRRADAVLVWGDALDADAAEARWPGCDGARRIGDGLCLVTGAGVVRTERLPATGGSSPPPGTPLEAAERALAVARDTGDAVRTLVAQVDLGHAALLAGDLLGAEAALVEAAAEARRRGDREREADALSSLAWAALRLGRPDHAERCLAPVLDYARSAQDPVAEKMALELLGGARRERGDHAGALGCFERAAALARGCGDAAHDAAMSWQAAIEQAELGRPDLAAGSAGHAVALMRKLGKPQAEWYARHLAQFRGAAARAGRGAGGPALAALAGGTVDTATVVHAAAAGTDGAVVGTPGVLRMAVTATKAMALFVGSGFKVAPPDVRRARLDACSSCEYYTGLRCRVCGCVTAAKAGLLHEVCPLAKWQR
jgi:tetratricopeptide (TPR) repeat protein